MAKVTLSYVLLDTTREIEYDEYLDYCVDNDKEPQGEESDDFFNYQMNAIRLESEVLMADMEYASNEGKENCIILGSVGLWDGRRKVYPVYCVDVKSAIEKCIGSADDVKVEMVNGVIKVTAYHHDGTNYFEIYKLSKKGLIAFQNERYGVIYGKEIKDYWLAKYHNYLF